MVFCIALLLSALLAAGAYSALSTSKTVTSNGRISTVNVGVYRDSACTQTASSVDWGNLTAGAQTTITLYVKNTGTARETLGMAASSWSPASASQYITIAWDRNNTALNANQVVGAVFTLTVSASVDAGITAFSNNIIITGTMQP